MAEEDVRQFKLHPPGRTRTTPPPWRAYNTRSKVLFTEFRVPIRAGEQERLIEKLSDIQKANRHAFPGTIARYVIKDPTQIQYEILRPKSRLGNIPNVNNE